MKLVRLPNYKKSHPPAWLEHSRIFRKLYAFRRIMHYTRRTRYADTDEFLSRLISWGVLPSKGFFVDVGCYHPVQQNTTYYLYRHGWQGINIDVDEVKIEACKLKRPRDISVVCAISERVGEVEYWKQSFWSQINSLEKIDDLAKLKQCRKSKVHADTLTNLIDQTPYRNRPIDFLSMDIEGHELPALRALDFDRYRPKVICTETWHTSLEDVVQSEVYGFLSSKGYILINWVYMNLVFRHSSCPAPKNVAKFHAHNALLREQESP